MIAYMEVIKISTLGDKINALRGNRGWTQAQLAERLFLSEDAVQKWEKDKNVPRLEEIKKICELFDVPIQVLTSDDDEVTRYFTIEHLSPDDLIPYHEDSEHEVIDAGLRGYGELHRFNNPGGEPYSAIYIGLIEKMSCEREREQHMVNYWNGEA